MGIIYAALKTDRAQQRVEQILEEIEDEQFVGYVECEDDMIIIMRKRSESIEKERAKHDCALCVHHDELYLYLPCSECYDSPDCQKPWHPSYFEPREKNE